MSYCNLNEMLLKAKSGKYAVGAFNIVDVMTVQAVIQAAEVKKSPVEMMTTISLERAFRQGGIEAVENQCEQALKLLGTRTASFLPYEFPRNFNGS